MSEIDKYIKDLSRIPIVKFGAHAYAGVAHLRSRLGEKMENQAIDRTFNFALLRYLHGSHENLVEELRGIANWKDVSDLALGRRRVSEYTARAVENRLKLPDRWLDRDHRDYFNASAGAYGLFRLAQEMSPEVCEAIKTILEHVRSVSPRGEVQRTLTRVQLSLVKN